MADQRRMIDLPIEIVALVSENLGYLPDNVAKVWRNTIEPSYALDALINRYGNLETIIRDGTKDNIVYAMKHVYEIPANVHMVARESAKKGYINILRWAMGIVVYDSEVPTYAGEGGHKGVIEYINNLYDTYDTTCRIIDGAIRGNHMDIVYKYISLYNIWNIGNTAIEVANTAAEIGNLALVKDVIEKSSIRYPYHYYSVAEHAAMGGHDDILDYICGMYDCDSDYISRGMAAGGHLDKYKEIVDNDTYHDYTGDIIATTKYGHMDIIKYIETKTTIDWNVVSSTAARHGHIDIVKYAVSKGADNWIVIANEGSRHGSIDIINYAASMGDICWSEVAEEAVFSNYPSIIWYAESMGEIDWDTVAYSAAINGHIDILRIALDNGASDMENILMYTTTGSLPEYVTKYIVDLCDEYESK